MTYKELEMISEIQDHDLEEEEEDFITFLCINNSESLTKDQLSRLIQIYERYIGYGIEG